MTVPKDPPKQRPPLWATETRLNAIISEWFVKQNGGEVSKETLGRRILESLEVMPDEFFEYVAKLGK